MILSTEVGALRAKTDERKAIEILAEAGFDALDYTFTPWMERGEMVWNGNEYHAYGKEVLQMAKDNGVYFNQAHAPFIFEIDGTPDWDKTIIPLQIRCMEACALLEIPHMVVHPIHHLPYKQNKAEIWDLNREYYARLKPHAQQHGVKIALENMFGEDKKRRCLVEDMFSNPYEFSEFYDELDDQENFICLIDTGHSGIVGEDPSETIRVMGHRVKGLHFSDNMHYSDDHLIPFQGLINWHEIMITLAEIGYEGDLTFEALHLWKGEDITFYKLQAKYLHDIGRYLIDLFTHHCEVINNER